jgi:hypothetical protein
MSTYDDYRTAMKATQPQESSSLIRRFHAKIEEELEQAGYRKEAIELAVFHLEEQRFYSVAVLLASDPATREVLKDRAVDEFLERLNKATSLDQEDLKILKELFTAIAMDDEEKVKQMLSDPRTRELAVDAVANCYSFPVKKVREAFELLEKGVYKQDLIGVTRMTLQLGDEIPGWLPTPDSNADSIRSIGSAIRKDGLDHYFLGRRILKDLRNNRMPSVKEKDFGVFDDTLRSLTTHMEMLDDLFDWSANVLSYPSVQISIAIWSSLHGIKLDTKDVDVLQQAFANRDLQPLIFRLMTRITENVKEFLWLS